MNWLRRLGNAFKRDHNVFSGHINHVLLPAGIVALLVLVPFQVNNVLQGRLLQSALLLLIQVVILVDVLALLRRRPAPIDFGWLLLPMLVGMVETIRVLGIYGALWAYPVVMACYFVLGRLRALVSGTGILIVVTASVALMVDPMLAVRVFATLAVTIGLTHLVVGAMLSMHVALREQSLTDPLTGAFNRRHMGQALDAVVEQSARHETRTALLAMDIDHFKRINDKLGHDAGDRVLTEVVRLINLRKRGADVLFRSGGEEFTLLLRDVDRDGALKAAEAIRATIAANAVLTGQPVTVCIGVCMHLPMMSRQRWMKLADDALYRAKAAGRNRVELADPDAPSDSAVMALAD